MAHVEAGVRNFDRSIPEEINRIVTDQCLTCCFVRHNCRGKPKQEGLSAFAHLTGDVMLDLFLVWERKIESLAESIIKELNLNAGEYLLVTLHRPLNVDDISRLKSILTALHESGRQIVFPVHPRTHKNITESELGEIMDSWFNFRQLPPLSYATFLALAKCAYGIVTDSGGVQKEAYFLGTPCTTIFPNTPWPETLKSGWNVLAEPEKDSLLKAVERPRPKGKRGTEFGKGDAALKIVKLLCNGR